MAEQVADMPVGFRECQCERPLVRYDLRGAFCQVCGFPRGNERAEEIVREALKDRKEKPDG